MTEITARTTRNAAIRRGPDHAEPQHPRQRMLADEPGPLLVADWRRAVFVHFRVSATALRPWVPYDLDTHDGDAWVSLVAFTMGRMRLRGAGRAGRLALLPIASHPFLNVRTYVVYRGEPGIYFLAEWLPNRLSTLLGPPTFGLPYRHGRLTYGHQPRRGRITGRVEAQRQAMAYRYAGPPITRFTRTADRRRDFLLERYTAFTDHRGVRARFRVYHRPWRAATVPGLELRDRSLLDGLGRWARSADYTHADCSPGVHDVWMGRPRRERIPSPLRRNHP